MSELPLFNILHKCLNRRKSTIQRHKGFVCF